MLIGHDWPGRSIAATSGVAEAASLRRLARVISRSLHPVSDGIPLMVAFYRADQAFENIGTGAGDPAPIGDHRHPERIVEKRFRGDLHALEKDFDGHPLFVAVEL